MAGTGIVEWWPSEVCARQHRRRRLPSAEIKAEAACEGADGLGGRWRRGGQEGRDTRFHPGYLHGDAGAGLAVLKLGCGKFQLALWRLRAGGGERERVAPRRKPARSAKRNEVAEKTNTPRAVVEASLAHVVRDKTEAAYFRSDLFDLRRKLMENWTKLVIARPATVVSIRA